MQKVTSKDFRQTKEIVLPSSGITVQCYSSLLIGDIPSNVPADNDLDNNLLVISKVIKEWNFFDKEEDEKPLEINLENLKKLPAPDLESLVSQLKDFSVDQKKT